MSENLYESSKIVVDKSEFDEELEKLKYCLRIGQIAYEQARDRLKSVDKRAENLVKYSTLLIAVTNLVVSLLGKGIVQIKDAPCIRDFYIVLMLVVIACIILSLMSQKPGRIMEFPDGVWMFEDMQKETEAYGNEQERVYDLILRYTASTESIEKVNDRAMKFLTISYILYVVAILLLMILFVLTIDL